MYGISWLAEIPSDSQELLYCVQLVRQFVSKLLVRSPVECRPSKHIDQVPDRRVIQPCPTHLAEVTNKVGEVSSAFPIFSRRGEVAGAVCSPADTEIPINQNLWLQRHLQKLHCNLLPFSANRDDDTLSSLVSLPILFSFLFAPRPNFQDQLLNTNSAKSNLVSNLQDLRSGLLPASRGTAVYIHFALFRLLAVRYPTDRVTVTLYRPVGEYGRFRSRHHLQDQSEKSYHDESLVPYF